MVLGSATLPVLRSSAINVREMYQVWSRMTATPGWFDALYNAVTAQIEHELDGLGYDGNVEGVEALERIKMAVADINGDRRRAELSALTPLPVGLSHAPHEDVAEGVIAHHEAGSATVGHHVIAGRFNDLPDALQVWAFEPPDGDLYPVAFVELHYPIVAEPGDLSYAACGLCGQVWGCDCMANPRVASSRECPVEPDRYEPVIPFKNIQERSS